jgi:hypothetical protein
LYVAKIDVPAIGTVGIAAAGEMGHSVFKRSPDGSAIILLLEIGTATGYRQSGLPCRQGSGHKVSHHPGSGIPRPSKNPDIMGIQAASVGSLFPAPASILCFFPSAVVTS